MCNLRVPVSINTVCPEKGRIFFVEKVCESFCGNANIGCIERLRILCQEGKDIASEKMKYVALIKV